MTFAYKCPKCSYEFTHSFRVVKFDDCEGHAPLRYSDKDTPMPCPSCEAECHVDEALTIHLGTPAYQDSPLTWAEKNGYASHIYDAASSDAHRSDGRRRSGVDRKMVGLPSREGGWSKRVY